MPFTRIGWYAYSPGSEPSVYHTWFLQRAPNGCLVVTEEVSKGAEGAKGAKGAHAKQLRNADEERTHRAHYLWIAGLKRMSEGS